MKHSREVGIFIKVIKCALNVAAKIRQNQRKRNP
jgi:hypothetical protein